MTDNKRNGPKHTQRYQKRSQTHLNLQYNFFLAIVFYRQSIHYRYFSPFLLVLQVMLRLIFFYSSKNQKFSTNVPIEV